MGARLYNPNTGRFLSRDPVAGGNDNTYTYPPDPINKFDLNGEWWSRRRWGSAWRSTQKWVGRGVKACSYMWGTAGTVCNGALAIHYARKHEWRKAAGYGVGMAVGSAAGRGFSRAVGKKAMTRRTYRYARHYTSYVHGWAANSAWSYNYRRRR